MGVGLGYGTAVEFFEQEFSKLALADVRLVKRAKRIMVSLQQHLGSCIQRIFSVPEEARQAYDFFSNPNVSSEKIMEEHYKKTVERIHQSSSKYILAIQDGMLLNYSKHPSKKKKGLGRVGKVGKTNLYGIIQHSTLCVTEKNEPLGLIDLQFWDYDELDTREPCYHRKIQDKATRCWLKSLYRTKERIGETQKKFIMVADREGDFYEFLHELCAEEVDFVIRAKHDRHTGENHRSRSEKMSILLEKAPVLAKYKIEKQNVRTRKMEIAILLVKATEILLPCPNKSKKEKIGKEDFGSIKINLIQVANATLKWNLLTTLPIGTLDQIREVVEIYRSRWHIEDYHKVLKTGYQVDEIYLHSSIDAIKNFLVMASISACRLYWLIYVGRVDGNIRCDSLFKDYEWKSLYVYFREKIPIIPPSLSEVILKIARLGGYKPQKRSRPPGIKTMWIGFQSLAVAAQMYHHMSTEKGEMA